MIAVAVIIIGAVLVFNSSILPIENFVGSARCQPRTEICDRIDNDCDKLIDEGNVCAVSDTTPPILGRGQPSGTLASNTTSAMLTLSTGEVSTCRYSTILNTLYSSMRGTFTTTAATYHSTPLLNLVSENTYTYYVRCMDNFGNANTQDYVITFSVAASETPAYPVSQLISSQPPLITLPRPEYLKPVALPGLGTSITRISDAATFGAGQRSYKHWYAKDQPWNSDGTRIMLSMDVPRVYFLDGQTYEYLWTATNVPEYPKWSNINPDL